MASGQGQDNPPAGSDEAARMKRVLIPALALAALVVIAAVIIGMNESGRKMSDGSNGTIDDPDLKTIETGVRYRDLVEGTGEPCPSNAVVKVNYTGWLPDGTDFDSARSAELNLYRVIIGWKIGMTGMKLHGKRKLVISPEKGYGSQGSGKIPAGSTLIFEIELLAILPPAESKENASTALLEGPGRRMSDGTDGGTADPDLRELGEGLKIRDLKEGNGEPVREHATVTVNYRGWLVDAKEFDSSQKHHGPQEFSLDNVVKGWSKGMLGMKPGGIRKIVIPPELGYGAKTMANIPPNSTLIFEVELIK